MSNITSTITPTDNITSVLSSPHATSVNTFSVGGQSISQLVDVDLQGVTNGSILIYKDNEFAAKQISGDISISVDGVVTLAPNSVVLGTDTTGAYVSTITGTQNQVLVSGSGDETSNITLSLPQSISVNSSPTFENITLNGVINNTNLTTQLNSKASVIDLNLHIGDNNNPHGVTASQVGLGDVDNTSDLNKPVSTATQNALDLKVDAVEGKGLSDQNYTLAEKNKLSGISAGATANSTDAHLLSRANHTGTQSHTTITGLGTLATQSGTFSGTSSGTNTGDQTITLGGDASGSGTSLVNVTLSNTGVSPGTYNNSIDGIHPYTVDVKGRITSVGSKVTLTPNWSNITNTPSTLLGYGITDAVNISGSQIITGAKDFHVSPTVPYPSQPYHAATKNYVDTLSEGLHVHASAHVILTDSLETITGGSVTYSNGTDGVGATLTCSTPLDVTGGDLDGDTHIAVGDRLIVAGQSNAAHNGIYTYSSPTQLIRASDFNSPTKMAGGDFIFVTHGDTYADTGWVLGEPVTSVGTSPVLFVQFSGAGAYEAGDGLQRQDLTFSAKGTEGRIAVTASGIDLATHGSPGTYKSVTVDAYGRVSSGSNPTTLSGYGITDAASASALSLHVSDASVHLTSTQNTLLDGITVTSDKVNYLSDVTSNIQAQINSKESTQTPVTQAEMEAGTETAVRSMSPLRIKQAVETHGKITSSTGTTLTGFIRGNGTTITDAIDGAEDCLSNTLTIRDFEGDVRANKFKFQADADQVVFATMASLATTSSRLYTFPDATGTVLLNQNGVVTLPANTSIGTVSSTEIGYLDGVTSAIQTQLNNKSASNHTHPVATPSVDGFLSSSDKTKLDGIAPGAEVNVNADWTATSGDAQILNKPTTLSGYGITDAINLSGTQTITGTKTFNAPTTIGNNFLTIQSTSANPSYGLKITNVDSFDPGTPLLVDGRGRVVHGMTFAAGITNFTNNSDHSHVQWTAQGRGNWQMIQNGGTSSTNRNTFVLTTVGSTASQTFFNETNAYSIDTTGVVASGTSPFIATGIKVNYNTAGSGLAVGDYVQITFNPGAAGVVANTYPGVVTAGPTAVTIAGSTKFQYTFSLEDFTSGVNWVPASARSELIYLNSSSVNNVRVSYAPTQIDGTRVSLSGNYSGIGRYVLVTINGHTAFEGQSTVLVIDTSTKIGLAPGSYNSFVKKVIDSNNFVISVGNPKNGWSTTSGTTGSTGWVIYKGSTDAVHQYTPALQHFFYQRFPTSDTSSTTTGGNRNVALGNSAEVDGNFSYSLGHKSAVFGEHSTALGGEDSFITGNYSTTLGGQGLVASGGYQTIIGKYNAVDSSSTKPLIVGWGTSDTNRANILELSNTVLSLTTKINTSDSITASSFIKTDGTSSQFLKADGSVDSNSYSQSSHVHTVATTSVDGFLSSSDKSKLDGIAPGAISSDFSIAMAIALG